ncbi:hypothetical protein ACGFNU_20100 [Spirillospora sp. NPDC048911]|uniref:hypothetical protein n=1 Tax=Spirillospora sp. NPDC048911 TaxID=3364527 RepID=UPI003712C5A5
MHKPGIPDDLPAPPELWARAATMAAVEAALPSEDFSAFFSVHANGVTHDDAGGNTWTLSLIEDGRAVLYGCDVEASRTRTREPALDLLADAPAWLPLERLASMQRGAELGFVYWHDTGWHRIDYPADLPDDGLASTVGLTADTERLVRHIAQDAVGQRWGGEEVEDDELMEALEETVRLAQDGALEDMVRQARERALSAQSFAWLGHGWEPDVSAALDVAARAGLVNGARGHR